MIKFLSFVILVVIIQCQYNYDYGDCGQYNSYGNQTDQMRLDRYQRSMDHAINRDMAERHRREDRLYREQRRIERKMDKMLPIPPADYGQIGKPQY